MRIMRSKIQYLPTTILIVVGVLMWLLSCGDMATAFDFHDFHADSAHGNESYGVNRTDLECPPGTGTPCPQGDCTHCHETFDPSICGLNNYLLFYDDWISKGDLFCYECHRTGEVTNYPYCVTFGGRGAFYANIKKQFTNAFSTFAECGSKHHLGRIWLVIKDNANNWGFNDDPDPCVACHNPHAAQKNHPVAIDGEGKLNTAIRRPSHYKSTNSADLLWGDDANERMSSYAISVGGTYQAPYYADTTSGRYEPDGSTSEPVDGWGSNTPDYVTFCLDCHQYTQYDAERGAAVKVINWSQDIHGEVQANTCNTSLPYEGTTKDPYTDPGANYVLSCLDCHEPHGTYKRLHLIRRMINGQLVDADSPDAWDACDSDPVDKSGICTPCHNWPHDDWGSCYGCHRFPNGAYPGFHGSRINMTASFPCNAEPGF